MSAKWIDGRSRRPGMPTIFAGTVALAALLAAGCAGGRTGGQVAAASTTTTTSTTRSAATTRSTSKPASNPILTVKIVNTSNLAGEVVVSPGDSTCATTCVYDKFAKGTSITLRASDATIEGHDRWEISGGKTSCDQQGTCGPFQLNDDMTVTAIFLGATPTS
jgi:hypothetical protein